MQEIRGTTVLHDAPADNLVDIDAREFDLFPRRLYPDYQAQLAWRYLTVGRCQAALPVLRTCLELAPHSALGWWLLGWAHHRLGKGQHCGARRLSGRSLRR